VMFTPDPDLLPIPDLGVKKAPDPGSATLSNSTKMFKLQLFYIKPNKPNNILWLMQNCSDFPTHVFYSVSDSCIWYGSGSNPDPGFWWPNWKKFQKKNIKKFGSKTIIYRTYP
jgi:hypothetical protein